MAILKPGCRRCGGNDIKLRRQIKANGSVAIGWWCLECHRWAIPGGAWLKHSEVEAHLLPFKSKIEDIPVAEDYSQDHPCVICGEPGEWHHFAPQAWAEEFGDDWRLWPGAYLCIKHHQQWHRIVTPSLVWHDKMD